MSKNVVKNHADFLWSVADLLRGDYKQSEYGKVILPLTVIRRLDCVLDPTKEKVLERHQELKGKLDNLDPVLTNVAGEQFYNTSKLDFPKLLDDPTNIADNLRAYVAGFSATARDIIEKFDLDTQIARLDQSNLLYLVVSKFCEIDLHPDVVSNQEMGYLYEELIRKFSELSNETAGEHFTPREVIELMVNLLFIEDDDLLAKPGIVKTMLDPAAGTGGMLSVSQQHLAKLNNAARLEVFGQELNAETYAICRSDMVLKGQDASNIVHGNSFSDDGHAGRTFDYLLANPPFGVEWKKIRKEVEDEAAQLGFAGRFGAGTPRINDGSFLFLQHMISKMKPVEQGGSRIAIVFNGSPLFTGAAGSGESEIRRWIIENDWLEAVVALPDQLFYNTGITTYFWIVTNRKSPQRRGKVQLIDARDHWAKMGKSLGDKRKYLTDDHIADITRIYGDFGDGAQSKILDNHELGFLRITVERPLRLRWEVSEETLAAVRADSTLARLGEGTVEEIAAALEPHLGLTTDDRDVIMDKLMPSLNRLNLTTAKARAVRDALGISDPDAPIVEVKGQPRPDANLRDYENVPLPPGSANYEVDPTGRIESGEYQQAIATYMAEEVLPYVPDVWVDHSKTKIGYEIPLTRHFYTYTPPRPVDEIDAEIKQLEAEIQTLLAEVTE